MLDADVVVLTLPGTIPSRARRLRPSTPPARATGSPARSSRSRARRSGPPRPPPATTRVRDVAPGRPPGRPPPIGAAAASSEEFRASEPRDASPRGWGRRRSRTIRRARSRTIRRARSRTIRRARSRTLGRSVWFCARRRPRAQETRVARHGVLYGGGALPRVPPRLPRRVEGRAAPVFGSGANRIPTCHVENLAACVAVLAQTALETARGAARVEPPVGIAWRYRSGRTPRDPTRDGIQSRRRVRRARREVPSRAYAEPSRPSADLSVGGEAGAFALASRGERTRFSPTSTRSRRARPSSRRISIPTTTNRPPRSIPPRGPSAGTEGRSASLFAPEREEEEEEVTGGSDRGGTERRRGAKTDASEGAAKRGRRLDAEPVRPGRWRPRPWADSPRRSAEFIAANGLPRKRVLVRGPPLKIRWSAAAEVAEAYSLPLLVPAELVATWLPNYSSMVLRGKVRRPDARGTTDKRWGRRRGGRGRERG